MTEYLFIGRDRHWKVTGEFETTVVVVAFDGGNLATIKSLWGDAGVSESTFRWRAVKMADGSMLEIFAQTTLSDPEIQERLLAADWD
jgi:hypothetical protein